MQVFDIISDATIINHKFAIGSSIIRFKSNSDDKVQIFRGVAVFEAKESFEAEIQIGLKSFELIFETNLIEENDLITWICDLEYLPNLIEKKKTVAGFECNNKILDSYIQKLHKITNQFNVEIKYPTKSSEFKYHQLCHRICSSIRIHILESGVVLKGNVSKEDLKITIEKYLIKYPSWQITNSV